MVSTRFKTIRLSPGVKITGAAIQEWMNLFDRAVEDSELYLTDLDRAIGDGDHGVNIHRGSKAVVARLNEFEPPDLPGHFRTISSTLTTSVGGASGPLFGAFFLHASPFRSLSLRALPRRSHRHHPGRVPGRHPAR